MITGTAIYDVLSALAPLYVAMILAYGSVRWWKAITVEQCAGINRYVSVVAVPLLGFHVIYNNDVYAMNFRFIAADCLQKVVMLVALFAWQAISKRGSLDWTISLFSIATLPNTLIIGVPLLAAMYGEFSGPLMVQFVVMQAVVWYNLLLILLEYRAAMELFSKQLPPEVACAVASFQVDSDVHSLACSEPLQTEAEVREDGKIEVVIRRSASCPRSSNFGSNRKLRTLSELTDVELYSVRSNSGKEVMTRQLSLYQKYYDHYKVSSANADTPWMHRVGSMNTEHKRLDHGENKDEGFKSNLHVFDWSSGRRESMSMGRDKGHAVILKPASGDVLIVDPSPADHIERETMPMTRGASEKVDKDVIIEAGETRGNDPSPPAYSEVCRKVIMFKLILTVVCRKIIRNPNTYASVGALVWSLISFRWGFGMPKIMEGSIAILSNTGLGMSMFSLGLFMTVQPKIITCGIKAAVLCMAVRFLVGPAVAAATGVAVGLRGDLLRVAVIQAALPQGIVAFVFAKEYDCHPDLLSTSVIFGTVVSLPVTIIYYLLIGL